MEQGGSFRTDHWRSEVDLLLINVARSAFVTGGSYEQRPPKVGDPSLSDFQLASLKALLASFLSSPHARPPYLAQGMELFRKGNYLLTCYLVIYRCNICFFLYNTIIYCSKYVITETKTLLQWICIGQNIS